jgi:hypothetical protein
MAQNCVDELDSYFKIKIEKNFVYIIYKLYDLYNLWKACGRRTPKF